ncbi:hypothetical protein PSYPI_47578, partial [Pseudomonas syringae pv. pisi str. 1704B]
VEIRFLSDLTEFGIRTQYLRLAFLPSSDSELRLVFFAIHGV